MRYNIAALCVLTLTLGGALLAQEPAPPAAPSLDALVSDLGSDDFAARERATEALRALGEKARDALETAKDSDNLERRTRVRRLLGDLESADAESDVAGRHGGRLTPVGPDDGRPQRQRVLRPGAPMPFPGGGTLDGRVDAYREALRRLIESTPQLGHPGLFGPGLTLEMDSPHAFRQTMRVQRGDESIQSSRLDNGSLKLEVTRPGPTGQDEVEVYEADSVEAFKQEHPGVYERYKDLGVFDGSQTFTFTLPTLGIGGLFPVVPHSPNALAPLRPATSPQVQLGVMVDAAPDVLRAHVDLPDRAVVVEEVVPGMPAETMGLALFDVITHVDGQPVGTAEDVRRALNREGAPDTVTVTILRRGARHELSAKRPVPR